MPECFYLACRTQLYSVVERNAQFSACMHLTLRPPARRAQRSPFANEKWRSSHVHPFSSNFPSTHTHIHPHTLTMACTIQTLSVSSLRAAAARAPRQQARRGLAVVRASSEETPAATEQPGGTYFFAGKSMSEAEVIEFVWSTPATQGAYNHLGAPCKPR